MVPENLHRIEDRIFDYMIIVKFDENVEPEYIIEIDWETFFKFKTYNIRMKNYVLSFTKKLIINSKIRYKKSV